MADAPAHQRGGVPMGSGAKPTSPPPTVTGELLFYHVTGHHPRGYQPSGVPPATEFLSDPSASADREDDGGRKKRRKVGNRRGKLSEIWFDEAELAFCTSVASIPPNGRTKIKFFGRPLGRNELIAAICTLATRKVYNRKQISSHSQVLKDKVPAPYKEIFTFEDKSRGGDDTGESATANVIENYRFPEAIYRLLDIPVGEDLANREKPRWLLELEAGDNANAPETTSTMNFWAPAETYEYGYAPGRSTDRDGRGRMPPYESTAYMQPLRARDMPFPAGLPPPSHLDPQSPVTASGSDHSRRYPYASGYPQRLSSSMWDPDHSHSPTNSQFDTQSQSSGVSPRQIPGPGSWGETKPQVLPSSSDHLRPLGQLQDQNAQWGPVASRGGVQALPLPSLAGAATSPTYGLSSPSWLSQPTAQGAGGYRAQTWNGDARESLRPSFTPGAVELSLYTQEAQYPLSPSRPADNVVNGLPIGLSEIPNYDTRYPFLTSQPYNTPVFHINVPLLLGAGRSERSTLLSHAPDMALRLSLNTTTDSSGWHVVTESSYCPPVGHGAPTPLDRGTQQIREMHKGHPYTLAMVPQLATLLQNFTNNAAAAINSSAEAFLHMAITYFAVVQRIVRDSTLYDRTYGSSIGSDWSESAAIVIYSFALSTDPNAQVICRPVDFDIRASPPRTVDPVSDLIAGEAAEPSTFAWMRGSG